MDEHTVYKKSWALAMRELGVRTLVGEGTVNVYDWVAQQRKQREQRDMKTQDTPTEATEVEVTAKHVSDSSDSGDSLSAVTSIAELEERVRAFDGCDLKKTATNTVFARGRADSGLMFIGEAPGNDEDEQGLPFVGRSGQLLDEALRCAGFDVAQDCYISNMVFWRPPGNRAP